MSAASKTRDFFENGSTGQFEWVLGQYDQALRLKAESKSSKPENVIKLDKWYQTELPKKIKARGKEAHLLHDELVQTIKWKLARGKYQANMLNLIQMNTPRVVQAETRKAFRNLFKKGDIQAASSALCNLKGVGPTMASAVLAAGAPHLAPFMADECLLAMPDGESLDYTMKEYMRFVEYVQKCVDRLNSQGGDWTPHKVELAVWTHYVINDLKPEILADIPEGKKMTSNVAEPAAPASRVDNSSAANGVENGQEDQETKVAVDADGEENSASSFPSSSSPPPEQPLDPEQQKQNGNGIIDSNDDASNGQISDISTNGQKIQPNGTSEESLDRVSETTMSTTTTAPENPSPVKMPISTTDDEKPDPAKTPQDTGNETNKRPATDLQEHATKKIKSDDE